MGTSQQILALLQGWYERHHDQIHIREGSLTLLAVKHCRPARGKKQVSASGRRQQLPRSPQLSRRACDQPNQFSPNVIASSTKPTSDQRWLKPHDFNWCRMLSDIDANRNLIAATRAYFQSCCRIGFLLSSLSRLFWISGVLVTLSTSTSIRHKQSQEGVAHM